MSISLCLAGPKDAWRFEKPDDDLFDNPVQALSLKAFLNDDRHHMALAIADNDHLVGFVSAVDYIHPDKPRELWINEVGVSEQWRRRGIATDLLRFIFDHGRTLNCVEAWVLTDHDNEPANALYRSVTRPMDEPPDNIVLHSFKLD